MPRKSEIDRGLEKLFDEIRPEESVSQLGPVSTRSDAALVRVDPQSAPLPARAGWSGRAGWSVGQNRLIFGSLGLLSLMVLVLVNLAMRASFFPSAIVIPTRTGPSLAPLTASLSEMEGSVAFRPPGQFRFQAVIPNQIITVSSAVKTGSQSRARLDLSNNSIVRLGENTLVALQSEHKLADGEHYHLDLGLGEIWIILRAGQVEVQTLSGLAVVHGSFLHVSFSPKNNATQISCLEGACELRNASGKVALLSGQTAIVYNAALPPDVGRMDNQDVTRWLVNNPEATLVFPSLKATNAALPSVTPGPSLTAPSGQVMTKQAPSAGVTQKPRPSQTPTITPTLRIRRTPTISKTPTNTLTRTSTPLPTLTARPSASATPVDTLTPSNTPTPLVAASATITSTPTVTAAPTLPPTPMSGCAGVTQIPISECNSLVGFYNSTTGSGWSSSLNWLTTDIPCAWYGVTCGSGHVVALVLPGNQLVGAIPADLAKLKNLQLLQLGDNHLTGSVPAEVGSLTNLTLLYLYNNQLSGPLPGALTNLVALTAVRMGGATSTLDSATSDVTLRNFLSARDPNWTLDTP